MYSVGAVIRRHLHSCRRSGTVILNLQTNHVSKIHWNIGTRCLITGNHCMDTLVSKPSHFLPFMQQKRAITKDSLSDIFEKYDEDGIPKDFELIYVAEIGNGLVMKYFVFGIFLLVYTFTLGFGALFYFGCWNIWEKFTFAGLSFSLPTYKIFLISQFLLVFTLWLYKGRYIAKLPVQRIYENPNKQDYIAIVKKDPFRTEKLEFNASDVQSISSDERKISRVGNVTIKGRECLIYAKDFKRPQQYHQIVESNKKNESTNKSRQSNS